MKRTKSIKKASLILCSDIHLREDTPTCWTGDFLEEQTKALLTLSRLQEKHECPVIHAGDLFHHWKPSPWLLSYAIEYLPNDFYTIYGQHDLPQHNWELREKSGIFTLDMAERIKVLRGYHYGQVPDEEESLPKSDNTGSKKILVWHHMTYTTAPFPGATGGQAEGILRKYPQFDLILTGGKSSNFLN